MNLYLLHGILNSFVFLVLFPIGALIAVFRNRLGPNWLKYHILFQISGVVLLMVSGSIILYAHAHSAKDGKPDDDNKPEHKTSRHAIFGIAVFALVAAQIMWAYFGKKIVDWSVWLNIHTVLASVLLLVGWYQVFLGARLYKKH